MPPYWPPVWTVRIKCFYHIDVFSIVIMQRHAWNQIHTFIWLYTFYVTEREILPLGGGNSDPAITTVNITGSFIFLAVFAQAIISLYRFILIKISRCLHLFYITNISLYRSKLLVRTSCLYMTTVFVHVKIRLLCKCKNM